MQTSIMVELATDGAVATARAYVYGFLASALSDPSRTHFQIALDPKIQGVALAAAELLASEIPELTDLTLGEESPQELDLAPVVRELKKPRGEIVQQHQELFGLLLGKAAPPYETEYCRQTLTFYRSQQLADIAGFYQAFGLEPSREDPERQDHIALELEFMAHLIQKELFAAAGKDPALQAKAPVCRDGQKSFFEAHLAWWVPAFAELLKRGAKEGLYRTLAHALACFIPGERAILGIEPAPSLAEAPRDPEPEPEDCSLEVSHG